METTQVSGVAKRRDMQRLLQIEDPTNGVKVKKEKSADQEAGLESQQKAEIEADDLWLRVKKEIKEEMDPDLEHSSFEVGVKEEIAEEEDQDLTGYHPEVATDHRVLEQSSKAATGQTATEPEPKPVAKRRRLSRKDMQGPMQTEGSRSAKKECADGVKVKKEKIAEQEAGFESPQKAKIEADDLWLRVKKEIKEEMDPDLEHSSFEVGVKEEIAEEEDQDLTGYHPEVATDHRVLEQSSKAATGQTATEPEPKPVAKRRRLSRKDMQGPMQTEGSRSAKKECADGVKVKKEKIADQEAGLESPHKAKIEADDLWLRVRKEVDRQSLESRASSLTGEAVSEEAGKLEGHANHCWVIHVKQ